MYCLIRRASADVEFKIKITIDIQIVVNEAIDNTLYINGVFSDIKMQLRQQYLFCDLTLTD